MPVTRQRRISNIRAAMLDPANARRGVVRRASQAHAQAAYHDNLLQGRRQMVGLATSMLLIYITWAALTYYAVTRGAIIYKLLGIKSEVRFLRDWAVRRTREPHGGLDARSETPPFPWDFPEYAHRIAAGSPLAPPRAPAAPSPPRPHHPAPLSLSPPPQPQIGVGADFGLGWIPPGLEAAEALLVTMFFGYLDHEPWLERYLDYLCVRRGSEAQNAPLDWGAFGLIIRSFLCPWALMGSLAGCAA